MANRSKQKGDRVERRIVHMFEGIGIPAKRVPLSGAVADYPHDVIVEHPKHGELSVECKARKNRDGFATLERWKGEADLLMLVSDRQEPRVYMTWEMFVALVKP